MNTDQDLDGLAVSQVYWTVWIWWSVTAAPQENKALADTGAVQSVP